MNQLYPLKFSPLFKDKVWGGQKIRTKMELDFSPLPNCGEAWVISGVPGNQTRISNGFLKDNELNELIEVYMDELVGEEVFAKFGNQFPILIKFIDSNDYLSIQVHPDDALAVKRKLSNGKSEMWYILDAEPGAQLISGFNRPMDADTYLRYLKENRLPEIMHFEKVEAGDLFFMPAGRIHALGPGILLAEIQQSSDTTYRLYDWDRKDTKGNPRKLHTEEALEAIDFTYHPSVRSSYRKVKNKSVTLISCPHFTANILQFDQPIEMDYSYFESFILYTCISGEAIITEGKERYPIHKGETMLLPAICQKMLLIPDSECTILSTYIS
jgi:mannose-6-phosphate isomerase